MTTWTARARMYFGELRRRRVFRTVAAYLVVAWLLLQVADVTFAPLGLDGRWQFWLIVAAAAGVVPAAVLAWVFDITGKGVVRTDDAPASPRPEPRAPHSPIASVAVLPFADLSQDHDQAWFCEGLAAEIIDSLCCVRGLRVASRSASFRFREAGADPREAARQLGVDAVLEGSVRKAGDTLRVSAQLVDGDSGHQLWGEAFERRLQDVFAIQTEIARQVAQSLRLSAAAPGLDRSERYAPRDIEAYEYYLRARHLMGSQGLSQASLALAPKLFRHAVELDPGYAQAHAGLADCLAQLVLWRFEKAEDVLPEATAAASRALDLAPDLAEAHVAQGHLRSLAGDGEGALRSFERALAIAPDLFEANYYFARHLLAQGDYARAADLFQRASRVHPDDFAVVALAVSAIAATGDKILADGLSRRAIAGLARQAEFEPDNARPRYMAASLYLRLGDVATGRALVEEALRLRPDDYATLYNVACFYSLAGEHERALDVLERCMAMFGYVDWVSNDPDFAALREHPRFRRIVAPAA